MKIFFYEIKMPALNRTYYFRHPANPFCRDEIDKGPLTLVYRASRIWSWCPETGDVKYIKNTPGDRITSPVDKREFFVVQLAAQDFES
jgi:hypothetical protein